MLRLGISGDKIWIYITGGDKTLPDYVLRLILRCVEEDVTGKIIKELPEL